MAAKAEQKKTRPRRSAGRKASSETTGARPEDKEAEVDLKDLEKAGEHFIMSAAELFVGTGYAIKGVKNLLEDEEGRKFLRELPYTVITKGFEMAKQAEEEYRARKGSRAGASKSKRSRKINIE